MLPLPAAAMRGAFELDAEMYLRNLVGIASPLTGEARRPIYASPRRLDPQLSGELLRMVQGEIGAAAGCSVVEVERNVSAALPLYLPFFRQYAPLREETLADQYFFDICVYLSYLFAETRVPASEARVALRNRVGEAVLSWLRRRRLVALPRPSAPSLTDAAAAAATGVGAILSAYLKLGLVGSFSFDDEDLRDETYLRSIFDEVQHAWPASLR